MGKHVDPRSYPHSELTDKIISAAMRVHSALGPGYLERIYSNALRHALAKEGLAVQQEARYQVYFDSLLVGEHVLDLVADGKVYVELKCISMITALEVAQVLSGLKASGIDVGSC
ncbi:MAG: GxxExxY protein [Planctomycetaceae bacterium]|nr:GxxExxY protein [Planctomycetaceae bacterium]